MSRSKPSNRGRRKSSTDLFIHTRNRLAHRYGQKMTREEHDELNKLVQNKEGEFMLRQTGSRSVWKLKPDFLNGEELIVVYNKQLSSVCTVLDELMFDQVMAEHRSSHAQS